MSKDQNDERKQIKRSNLQDIRSELQNLRSDVHEVKDTWENDKPNAKRTTRYKIKKHRTKIAGLIALAIPAYYVLSIEIPNPPEWIYIVLGGIIAGCIVGYIPAKYVVERFVKDTRKPLLEIDATEPNDIALWYVPEERIPDIEVYNGEKNTIETKKGMGYEVEKFEKVTNEGKQHLIAKGTWIGEKSGLELERNIMNIEGMKNHMKPYAMKGFAYDVMFPHIMRELQSIVGNQMARSFENVAVFKGNDLRTEVDELIDEYRPDNIVNKVEDSDIDPEQAMKNGDSEIDEDKLRRIIN